MLKYYLCVVQIRFAIDQLEGPQPVDVRLMKKRTGESQLNAGPLTFPLVFDHRANLLPFRPREFYQIIKQI